MLQQRQDSRRQTQNPDQIVRVEPFQRAAIDALEGPATHVLIYGGSGSGKTHLLLTWIVIRALQEPNSTHAIFRFRFAHLQGSIINETLPKVCRILSPNRQLYVLNKTSGNWCAEFYNGSRIYFGGLDDKDRTEKILGTEFVTIYLNESSQVSYSAFVKASTRLRQVNGLRLKLVCDENPPQCGHWTERLWVKGVDPDGKSINRADYAAVMMHPKDSPYVDESYKLRLQAYGPRDRLRFWEGQFGASTSNPLWTYASIEAARVPVAPAGMRIGIIIDPSGCAGPEDERSDEVGISVCGVADGIVYVLEDASGRYGPSGEDGWGAKAIGLFAKYNADFIAAEKNFGGAMVAAVVKTAEYKDGETLIKGSSIPFREITASSGKHVRAEPVGTLTDVGRLKFVDRGINSFPFPELREQLVSFSTAGYTGHKSPDRADAMVHGAYALGVVQMSGQGIWDFYEKQGWKRDEAPKEAPRSISISIEPSSLVPLLAPADKQHGTFTTRKGRPYSITSGFVSVDPADVDDLLALGFRRLS